MGRYIKLICPHCNKIIKNWHRDNTYGMTDIGIPFETCPYCDNIIMKKGIKEKNMLTKFDYIKMWTTNILSGMLITIFPTIIIANITTNLLKLNEELSIILTLIISFMFFIWYLFKSYNLQKKQLAESEERLKNKNYKEFVEKIKNDL